MEEMAYIDDYFAGNLPPEEQKHFDQRIQSDKEFAEQVAFFLSTKQALAAAESAETKERFRSLYQVDGHQGNLRQVRRLWPYLAAAVLIGFAVVAWFLFSARSENPQQLADKYIQENLIKLDVTMGAKEDGIQPGLNLYNEKRDSEALTFFENMIRKDSSNYEAKKYAGIVSLRLKSYDKALDYFTQCETYHRLYANPAVFYQALTLMERNHKGDSDSAKQLLLQVVQHDLEYKEVAQEWLKNW